MGTVIVIFFRDVRCVLGTVKNLTWDRFAVPIWLQSSLLLRTLQSGMKGIIVIAEPK